MLPMKAVRLKLGELLAADATTLAPAADANKIALIAAPFVEDETLVVGDLTLASFTGSTPLEGEIGAQQAGIDPATQEQVITILAPAGGWRWECTVAPAEPQAIYGYALVDNAGTDLLGVAALPEAITIASVGDFIDLGSVNLRVVLQPLS